MPVPAGRSENNVQAVDMLALAFADSLLAQGEHSISTRRYIASGYLSLTPFN